MGRVSKTAEQNSTCTRPGINRRIAGQRRAQQKLETLNLYWSGSTHLLDFLQQYLADNWPGMGAEGKEGSVNKMWGLG